MSSTTTHRKHSAKLFPLRLCEVLENEFVTTRGPLAQAPTWLLRDGDIDFAVLGSCLQTSLQSSETTPLALVAAKLQRAGISIPAIGPWPENAADQIRDALNRLVSADENLYDHNLLDPDSEVWQLAELWQERSKRPTPSGSGAPHHGEEAQPDQDARCTRDVRASVVRDRTE